MATPLMGLGGLRRAAPRPLKAAGSGGGAGWGGGGAPPAASAKAAAAPLQQLVGDAIARRAQLVAKLKADGTEAYRLFHGTSEGRPGLTVDRYGEECTLVQSWGELLDEGELGELQEMFPGMLYNPRGRSAREFWEENGGQKGERAGGTFTELGLTYRFSFKPGGDPSLYLDFRPARRWLMANAEGLDVLNAFAYTCGAGVAAAAGGCRLAVNTDHGGACLELGRDNAQLNGVNPASIEYVKGDYYPTVRQMAGLKVGGRQSARQKGFTRVPRQEFDVVVLDPPTKTKSRWGAVDIEGDYSSLAKPALLTLREGGGSLLATNHSPRVRMEEWVDSVERCGRKAGRPVKSVTPLPVEEDYPSFDGAPPLKMCVFKFD